MSRVVLVTGGFDPVHSGHIRYFKSAAELGDILVVGINSDEWLIRKKGAYFLTAKERSAIIKELRCVDKVIEFKDDDNSAKGAIRKVLEMYPDSQVIFANGGDRGKDNIPEMDIESNRVDFVFAVGGDDKANSSSWILADYLERERFLAKKK
jgi:D-beta-D-heptose 7-phosphate kinase/D-beta-D-heptose 1-phosphate adenosyltransferase